MSKPVDPYRNREKKKYANPIASRELILEMVKKSRGPQTRDQLAKKLGITDEEGLEALRRRLRAMARDGQLVCNRRGEYVPVDESTLVRGRVIAHPDGFGFLVPDEGGEDLFLSPRVMHSLLHGDRAVCRIVGVDRRGRREGELVEVLERAHSEIIGRLIEEAGNHYVVPDNKRIHQDVFIPPEYLGEAEVGQIVVAAITQQPNRHSQPIGRITEVVGSHMAPGMEIDIAIRTHELPNEWPRAVLEEIKAFTEEVPEEAKQGRVDLRDVPLVTIDGVDARDFDDAVYCERQGNGWRLLVAIADVSAYVEPGSALDESAYERGTSVYFPKQVIPMLPEVLSNGLCSINPDVDRLCMVCEMDIGPRGAIRKFRFFEGLMRSHARLTYDEVAAIVVDRDEALRKKRKAVVPHLEELHRLYRALLGDRKRRGAIDFETTETYFEFDEDRKIKAIVPLQRNDAHKMIEECMIAANVAAARFTKKHKIATLYRVHDGPKPEKIEALREFLSEFGLTLGGGDKPTPKDFSKVMKEIGDRPDRELIQTVMLRSMSQAVYSPDGDTGHFGLARADYAHFTSPIRRYPDLLLHRAIRHLVRGGKASDFIYNHEEMVVKGEHCSMCERRADEATRDVSDWLKCEYMLDKVGERFSGTVSAVTGFGLFIALDDIFIEGLLHITSLMRDFYEFDAVGHRLIGKNSGRIFRLGDRMEVIVARVDLDEKKIDFELPQDQEAPVEKPRKKKRPPKKKKKSLPPAETEQPAAPASEEKKGGGKKKRGGRKSRPRGKQGGKKGRSGRKGD